MGSIHLTSPSATSNMASKGTLNYKIKYVSDPSVQKLHVTVVSASLPKKGMGKVDPYVRVYLMPGTHMELKTKMISNNQNPVFNDEFSFVLKPDDVRRKTIVFQVYDKDTFSKDDGLGEVQVPLWNIIDLEAETMNTMKLASHSLAQEIQLWKNIQPLETDQAMQAQARGTIAIMSRVPTHNHIVTVMLELLLEVLGPTLDRNQAALAVMRKMSHAAQLVQVD